MFVLTRLTELTSRTSLLLAAKGLMTQLDFLFGYTWMTHSPIYFLILIFFNIHLLWHKCIWAVWFPGVIVEAVDSEMVNF